MTDKQNKQSIGRFRRKPVTCPEHLTQQPNMEKEVKYDFTKPYNKFYTLW